MRRIVRDHVPATIDRQRPDLETFISEKLVFPASSHRVLAPPLTVRILEASSLRLTPQFGANFRLTSGFAKKVKSESDNLDPLLRFTRRPNSPSRIVHMGHSSTRALPIGKYYPQNRSRRRHQSRKGSNNCSNQSPTVLRRLSPRRCWR